VTSPGPVRLKRPSCWSWSRSARSCWPESCWRASRIVNRVQRAW